MKNNKDIDKESLNEVIHLSKKILKVIYVMVIVAIILGVLLFAKQIKILPFIGGVLNVISPLFIGFVIAWLFYPLHKKMTKKGINKVLSALLIFLVIVGVVVGFIWIFVPIVYKQINDLLGYIPGAMEEITAFLTKTIDKISLEGVDMSSLKTSLLNSGQKLIVNYTTAIPNGVVGFIKGFFSTMGTVLISLVVGIYMLIDFENIRDNFYKILPKKDHEDYVSLFDSIGSNARRVVNGTLLVAFAVFVCDTIGFSLIGLNGGVLFGILCGVTDLIPYIGPYIGGAAAVIVGFTQSPAIGIGVLIVAIVVQALESYILQPVVMSKAMQLHPIVIIIGLLLFGYFFGILGMVLATPCMSIIKEIIIFINKKRKHQLESK